VTWSFSNHNIFRRCQRQWYYKNVYAHWNAKDPLRQECYRLSKLKNIKAWRGNIVDEVVSTTVIPKIGTGQIIPFPKALKRAKYLFDIQKQAMFKASQGKELVKAGKDKYGGFFEEEYGDGLSEDDFQESWREINDAISLFYKCAELQGLLNKAQVLVPQRPLSFKHNGSTVAARPDVIGFFKKGSPIIIDWKVHSYAIKDYWLQLATYAVALSRCKPHKDWKSIYRPVSPCDIKLFEAQLLTNDIREHYISNEEIEDLEDLIDSSASTMHLAFGGLDRKEITAEDFAAARNPYTCQNCNFRKLCWGDSHE